MSNSKSVKTRKDVEKVLKIGDKCHKFVPEPSFKGPPYQLPTGKDVIQRCISEPNYKKCSKDVAKEIYDLWVWCNIYPVSEQQIASKVNRFVTEFNR